jgi:putative protein kinase ArgK-like GTPase of G3E family
MLDYADIIVVNKFEKKGRRSSADAEKAATIPHSLPKDKLYKHASASFLTLMR